MKIIYPIPLRAAVIFTSCLALASPQSSAAEEPPTASRVEQPSEKSENVLAELEAASTNDERLALAAELAEIRPAAIETLKAHLARTRSSSDEERRAVLSAAGAAVPDDKGRFKTPGRETKRAEKNNDNFDWLEAIAKLPAQAGLGEVVSDVAAIRALASSANYQGGGVVVAFAFTDTGLIYRDECGRYLRKMSPYSLPALIHGSQNRRNKSMKRYTTYQLERLDRQNAHKAFAAAPTEDLQIAIVTAFADSHYREAVFAVLANVNHVAPRVRAATRAAWIEYVSGKAPRKPPERKLELTNGKLSDDKEQLWLDHRALADVAIREKLKTLTGSKVPANATLKQLTEKLFGIYDDERKTALNRDFEAALTLMESGKANQATPIYDRILTQYPSFSRRDEMVPAYLALAEALEGDEKWTEAGVAYGKASAVAPGSPQASEALKKHHLARAKAAEAIGEDASTELAIAEEIVPPRVTRHSKLLLFAGLGAIASALVLLILGLVLRRRPSPASPS